MLEEKKVLVVDDEKSIISGLHIGSDDYPIINNSIKVGTINIGHYGKSR